MQGFSRKLLPFSYSFSSKKNVLFAPYISITREEPHTLRRAPCKLELFYEQKESDMYCFSQSNLEALVGRLCVSG